MFGSNETPLFLVAAADARQAGIWRASLQRLFFATAAPLAFFAPDIFDVPASQSGPRRRRARFLSGCLAVDTGFHTRRNDFSRNMRRSPCSICCVRHTCIPVFLPSPHHSPFLHPLRCSFYRHPTWLNCVDRFSIRIGGHHNIASFLDARYNPCSTVNLERLRDRSVLSHRLAVLARRILLRLKAVHSIRQPTLL